MSLTPYYQDTLVTLYHGDARELVPQLGPVDSIITDPVWPNSTPELAGADDPAGLLAAVAQHFPGRCERVVVQLGCDSDPRFLQAIPAALPFFRVCWLEYVRPHYKGRLMYTSDVAYAFGAPPPSKIGARVIPGRMIQNDAERRRAGHPCPRQLQHVRWLVRWFAAGPVLDPFAGLGTTLRAAKDCGYPVIGVELEERYCEAAARWCEQQDVLPLEFEEEVA